MIPARKQGEQVSKITATAIAQPSDVFDTGKWVLCVVSYGEFALDYGAANKRAGCFSLHQSGLFIVPEINWFVGIVTHLESSQSRCDTQTRLNESSGQDFVTTA